MRYIVYGLAILASLLAIAFTTGNLPRDATASHNKTNGTLNALQLEQTNDAKGSALDRKSLTRSIDSSRR